MQYVVQQNGNKQHFTINSATSSNAANRETLNPFITHLTSFSQYGLRLTLTCIHVGLIVFVSIHMPWNSHSDWRNGWWVHHCRDECCTPQQSLTIVVPGRIHALMMTSNVSVERSATGVTDSRLPPTTTQAIARNRPQLHFCWSIYSIFPKHCHPYQPPLKKICKEQIKMKFNIGL